MLNNTGLFENGCKNPDLIVAFSTKIQASGENSGGRGEDILRKGRLPVPAPRSSRFRFSLNYFKFT